MRRLGRTAAVISCVVGLAAMPASANNSITITEALRTGNAATVSGTAAFATITEPQSVGGTNTQFANAAVADAAGINLTDAKILPLPDGSGLRFIWQLAAMPAQVPPEGVRYTWAFAIGETQYQLQAKRTNMASITTAEDPVGHVKQLAAGDFFQLRGACTTNYEGAPLSGCYHLAFLDGAFDPAAKTVSIDLPFQTRDAIGRLVAENFKRGVTILAAESAGMSVSANLQAVASTANMADFINGWDPYHSGPRVDLAVGSPTANPANLTYNTPATLTGSTFSGTVSGFTATATTVFARACNGTNATCSYAQLTP